MRDDYTPKKPPEKTTVVDALLRDLHATDLSPSKQRAAVSRCKDLGARPRQ